MSLPQETLGIRRAGFSPASRYSCRHSHFCTVHQTLRSDFAPFVIGQVRGYAYQSDFDKADLARDTSAQNPRQLVSMLLAGRIDIIVGDRTQLLYFAQEQRALHNVRILPRPLVQMPRYVAFAKGDKARAERFAEALERVRASGALDKILQQWEQ